MFQQIGLAEHRFVILLILSVENSANFLPTLKGLYDDLHIYRFIKNKSYTQSHATDPWSGAILFDAVKFLENLAVLSGTVSNSYGGPFSIFYIKFCSEKKTILQFYNISHIYNIYYARIFTKFTGFTDFFRKILKHPVLLMKM